MRHRFNISLTILLCLFLTILSCKNDKIEFNILGTFESVKSPAVAMDYFVYVKNFKDIPSHWQAMENFAKSKKDDKMLYQVFNFIYEDSASAMPQKIDQNEFREKYAKDCILAYHIIQGVSPNMVVKYPYRDKPKDDEPKEYLNNSDQDSQQQKSSP